HPARLGDEDLGDSLGGFAGDRQRPDSAHADGVRVRRPRRGAEVAGLAAFRDLADHGLGGRAPAPGSHSPAPPGAAELQECEAKVFEALAAAVKQQHTKEVLHFAATAGPGSLAGHHLVLATKDERSGLLLKDVLAREGSWAEGGVLPQVRGPAPRERTL